MKTHNNIIFVILGFVILITSIAITYVAVKKPQELREKAATPEGSETIFLSPSNNTAYINQSMTVNIMANLTGKTIDGAQIVASISGTIPSNLTYTPATISDLDILTHGLIPTSTGKRWQLLYRSFDVAKPYTGTGLVSLGTLTFTGTESGTMTITFDAALTKIVQNQTTNDIVQLPEPGTYTFIAPVPTPTSTPIPTPTSTPTPMPTNTPIPTATPIPTSTPTPTPIACNRADIDKNGTVNGADITLLRSVFWQSPPTIIRADINGDGIVDLTDYSILVASYNSSTGACQ